MDGFCIFLGYSVQHTFISFFLWMSAMAMNMTYKFSDIFKVIILVMTMYIVEIDAYVVEIDDHAVDFDDLFLKEESKEHQKTLVAITAYSQVPLISITHEKTL